MFTGIIQDIGTITETAPHAGGGITAAVQTSLPAESLKTGASVACAGACLTVTKASQGQFWVDISPETLARTNLSGWQKGTRVNLEPSLRAGDPLDGHIVSGHVDGLAKLLSITPEGNSYSVAIEIPEQWRKFMAEKGSVTLDGVSLTVNRVRGAAIELMIIPHTWQHTCFQFYAPGVTINLEIDVLARYVARLTEK